MHVQRTGSSSVNYSLRKLGVWAEPAPGKLNKLLTRLPIRRSPGSARFRGHDSLPFVKRRLAAEIFNSYIKAAFVRNPYSWLTSMYSTYKRGPNHRHHPTVAAMSGFPEYIDWEIKRNKRFQHIFLLDEHGELALDFVGRFDNLVADYRRLCDLIGVAAPELAHKNKNRFRHYREFYDDATRDKVTEFWAKDIELLGYDFDGNRQSSVLDSLG